MGIRSGLRFRGWTVQDDVPGAGAPARFPSLQTVGQHPVVDMAGIDRGLPLTEIATGEAAVVGPG